jgi:hypothetical protein
MPKFRSIKLQFRVDGWSCNMPRFACPDGRKMDLEWWYRRYLRLEASVEAPGSRNPSIITEANWEHKVVQGHYLYRGIDHDLEREFIELNSIDPSVVHFFHGTTGDIPASGPATKEEILAKAAYSFEQWRTDWGKPPRTYDTSQDSEVDSEEGSEEDSDGESDGESDGDDVGDSDGDDVGDFDGYSDVYSDGDDWGL